MPNSKDSKPLAGAAEVVRTLSGPNDGMAFASLALDWGAIAGIAFFCQKNPSWCVYLAGIWIIGIFQYALYDGLIHEAAHYTLFSRRTWNDSLDFLYALPFFETTGQYRELHLDHHRYLGRPGDHLVEDYRYHGLPEDPRDLTSPFYTLVVRPLLGRNAFYLVSDTAQNFRPFFWRGFRLTVFWVCVLSACFMTGTLGVLFWYWMVPLIACFPAILFWSEVEDHYGTESGIRTCLGFKNFFTHNSGYHWVHHHYPSIPWYRLPEGHAALFPADNSDVTSGFCETYRGLASRHQKSSY